MILLIVFQIDKCAIQWFLSIISLDVFTVEQTNAPDYLEHLVLADVHGNCGTSTQGHHQLPTNTLLLSLS